MNLAAINEQQFSCLYKLTENNNKARFLSACLYRWQNSTYSLNDQKKWFTRPLTILAQEAGISVRTASRYLAEFVEKGLIEKRNKLFIKKHLYIRITEKLLSQLNIESKEQSLASQQPDMPNNNTANTGGSFNLPSDGIIENAKTAESIYKDNNINCNSTVSDNGIVNNAFALDKKQDDTAPVQQQLANDYKVEAILGERITERFKNYVKGVLNNLKTQHNVVFSNPDKLFAEVIFSVINTKEQFPGIENPHHRMNIIAKLLRERRWKTPKGFYNHWDIGKLFKEREEVKERQYQAQKQEEGVHYVSEPEQKGEVKARYQHSYRVQNNQSKAAVHTKNREKLKLNTEINELKREIQTETNYLNQAKTWLAKKMSGITEEFIERLECKIAAMYETMTELQAKGGMT